MSFIEETRIRMYGILTVVVKDSNGSIIRTFTDNNKIMFNAADVIVALLAQRASDFPGGRPAQIPNNQIYSMRMGTSNTAPSRNNTNLGNPIIGKVMGDNNKITVLPGEVSFSTTLELGDGNGNTFQEAGLFTKGSGTGALDAPGILVTTPRLFARQVHPAIPKTNAISIEYTWKIAFTA